MSYALMELDTGNMVGFFPTERAALEEVLDSITRYGIDSVDTLGLAYNDPAGPVRRIAAGAGLAQSALAIISPGTSSGSLKPATPDHNRAPALPNG